jgi:hypothetical protein
MFGGFFLRIRPRRKGDDVLRIGNLTHRENVRGGRKVILGEVATRL